MIVMFVLIVALLSMALIGAFIESMRSARRIKELEAQLQISTKNATQARFEQSVMEGRLKLLKGSLQSNQTVDKLKVFQQYIDQTSEDLDEMKEYLQRLVDDLTEVSKHE